MADKSEIILGRNPRESSEPAHKQAQSDLRSLIEIIFVFGLILAAIWTPQGRLNALFSVTAAACVVVIAIAGRWNPSEMGLTQPFAGAGNILLIGAALCGVIWFAGPGLRFAGPSYAISWGRSWQYGIWALVQEFILQSIFFIRFESMLGSQRAVLLSATLYAAAHIPSPVLTLLSFAGGLLFCKLFRRYRNILPLGIIHAALGLTIAASLPDKWLHHMRVGIGYLTIH